MDIPKVGSTCGSDIRPNNTVQLLKDRFWRVLDATDELNEVSNDPNNHVWMTRQWLNKEPVCGIV